MMDVVINRQAILLEILRIDTEMNAINRDRTYLTLKNNLINLERKKFGSSVTEVMSPDDFSKVLTLRSNSPKMRALISRYRERRSEYEDELSRLHSRKSELKNQLFRS